MGAQHNIQITDIDKEALAEIVQVLNVRLGIQLDPHATPQRIREMMQADGVSPESNLFSREILHMRYAEE
jgi:metal-sulfur cluster biosynthetic enzyme